MFKFLNLNVKLINILDLNLLKIYCDWDCLDILNKIEVCVIWEFGIKSYVIYLVNKYFYYFKF